MKANQKSLLKGGLNTLMGATPTPTNDEVKEVAPEIPNEESAPTETPQPSSSTPRAKRGRPSNAERALRGEMDKTERATFVVKSNLLDKVKQIALTVGVHNSDVVNEALELAISKYESKHGAIEIHKPTGKGKIF